jgi:hypothetical protein
MEIKTCKIFLQKVFVILLLLYIFSNTAIADLDKDLVSAINRNDYDEFISLFSVALSKANLKMALLLKNEGAVPSNLLDFVNFRF